MAFGLWSSIEFVIFITVNASLSMTHSFISVHTKHSDCQYDINNFLFTPMRMPGSLTEFFFMLMQQFLIVQLILLKKMVVWQKSSVELMYVSSQTKVHVAHLFCIWSTHWKLCVQAVSISKPLQTTYQWPLIWLVLATFSGNQSNVEHWFCES